MAMQYQFNRESITPAYVKCARTPASRQEAAEQLAAALAACNVKPTVVPGFKSPAPKPVRRKWIDPETRLKREKRKIPKNVAEDFARYRQIEEEKARISAMADAMENKK